MKQSLGYSLALRACSNICFTSTFLPSGKRVVTLVVGYGTYLQIMLGRWWEQRVKYMQTGEGFSPFKSVVVWKDIWLKACGHWKFWNLMFCGFLIPLSHAKAVRGSGLLHVLLGTWCYLNQHLMIGVCVFQATQEKNAGRDVTEMIQHIRKLHSPHLP